MQISRDQPLFKKSDEAQIYDKSAFVINPSDNWGVAYLWTF